MKHDTYHVTFDTKRAVNILLKLQLLSSSGLGVMMFECLEEKDESLNEQPGYTGSVKKYCQIF